MKPELFIGYSVEGLDIAEAIERDFQHKFYCYALERWCFQLN